MNAAFETARVLDALLERQADWPAVFAQLEQSRRPNAAAIAQMRWRTTPRCAMRCWTHASCAAGDLALGLERRFPDRFIPRYSMVMFTRRFVRRGAASRAGCRAQLFG